MVRGIHFGFIRKRLALTGGKASGIIQFDHCVERVAAQSRATGETGMSFLKKAEFLEKVGPGLAFLLGRAGWATMRMQVFGSKHLAQAYEGHGQAILAFWHNRLFLFPYIYRYRMNLSRLVAVVSQSRDGQFTADFLEIFGFGAIRGSSSKGGVGSFVKAVRMAREGYDIAIATDGPRGPRYQVQPGVIKLAQMTSLPIVPACYQASIRRELDSWDKFIVPGFFSKIVMEMAPIISVPRRAGPDQLERARQQLQKELMDLNASSLIHLKQQGEPGWVMGRCTGDRRD